MFSHTSKLYQNIENNRDIFIIRNNVRDWAATAISLLDANASTAILRHYKDKCYFNKSNAKDDAIILTENGLDFVYIPEAPVEEITTSAAWLFMATARYLMLSDFTVYDFIHEVPAEGEVDKKAVSSVQKRLALLEANKENKERFYKATQSLLKFFNYTSIDETHISKLFETISDQQYKISLCYELPLHCAMNYHRSKGLEFEQVILFFEDYANFKSVNDSDINHHYVACTRAKSRLVIVSTKHDDTTAFKKKLQELFAGKELGKLFTIVPEKI